MSSRHLSCIVLAVTLAGCSADASSLVPYQREPEPRVPLVSLEPADDYRIGSPDVLEIKIFELEKPGEITSLEAVVPVEGSIMIPYAGSVLAKGETLPNLKRSIERALEKVIRDPQITLTIKDYESHEIAVMGAVEKAGVFHINRNRITLVEALSLAGGLAHSREVWAGPRVLVFAPRVAPALGAQIPAASSTPCVEIDLVSLLVRGNTRDNIWVSPGSVVQVPQAEDFYVQGYVNKGGAFPYRKPTTLLEAIATAGGFDEKRASRSAVRIKRPTRDGAEIIEVDASAVAAGDAPDVPIFPGDTVDAGRTVAWAIFSEFIEDVRGLVGIGFNSGTIP